MSFYDKLKFDAQGLIPGDHSGTENRPRGDDGLDEPRLAGKHHRHRQDPLLEPLTPEILDEGRGKRQYANRQGYRLRLRRRLSAHPSGANRPGLPRRL